MTTSSNFTNNDGRRGARKRERGACGSEPLSNLDSASCKLPLDLWFHVDAEDSQELHSKERSRSSNCRGNAGPLRSKLMMVPLHARQRNWSIISLFLRCRRSGCELLCQTASARPTLHGDDVLLVQSNVPPSLLDSLSHVAALQLWSSHNDSIVAAGCHDPRLLFSFKKCLLASKFAQAAFEDGSCLRLIS
jgi:hypothetical protein